MFLEVVQQGVGKELLGKPKIALRLRKQIKIASKSWYLCTSTFTLNVMTFGGHLNLSIHMIVDAFASLVDVVEAIVEKTLIAGGFRLLLRGKTNVARHQT